jgi:hypothetical protein
MAMRRFIVALPLLSAACGFSRAPEIEGAWISDPTPTIASIAKAAGIAPEERERYSDPDLFGQMIHIWGKRRGLAIFEGNCGAVVSYFTLRRGPGYIDLLLWGPAWIEFERKKIFLDDHALAVPILEGRAREYLKPIPIAVLLERYPCLEEYLAELDLDAA